MLDEEKSKKHAGLPQQSGMAQGHILSMGGAALTAVAAFLVGLACIREQQANKQTNKQIKELAPKSFSSF
jgi:hypothetical protein